VPTLTGDVPYGRHGATRWLAMTAALPSRVCDLNSAISHRMLTLELRKLEDADAGRSQARAIAWCAR